MYGICRHKAGLHFSHPGSRPCLPSRRPSSRQSCCRASRCRSSGRFPSVSGPYYGTRNRCIRPFGTGACAASIMLSSSCFTYFLLCSLCGFASYSSFSSRSLFSICSRFSTNSFVIRLLQKSVVTIHVIVPYKRALEQHFHVFTTVSLRRIRVRSKGF